MLHRRISSYILLAIFILSITHNATIVNSAQSTNPSKTKEDVKSDPNSHHAASKMTELSNVLIGFYEILHLTDSNNWVNDIISASTKLFLEMTDLCGKVTVYEDAVSVFADLFFVANEVKKSLLLTQHIDSWTTIKQNRFYEISNLMQFWIILCNEKHADSEMTDLLDFINSENSPTTQLEQYLEILKRLVSHFEKSEDAMLLILKHLLLHCSPSTNGGSLELYPLEDLLEILLTLSSKIEVSENSIILIESLSYFAINNKQLEEYHKGIISSVMENLIPKVPASGDTISVIRNILDFAIKFLLRPIQITFLFPIIQNNNGLKLHLLHKILKELPPLIERIEHSADVASLKQSLMIIKNWLLPSFGRKDIDQMLDEMIEKLSNVNA